MTVFDPWFKPDVRGMHEYGREDRQKRRANQGCLDVPVRTQGRGDSGLGVRGNFGKRCISTSGMVDTSDFTISYCPTNIYSVGTPHEIITATLQHKPGFIWFPARRSIFQLSSQIARSPKAMIPRVRTLLAQLEWEVPIKENPRAIPSLWYIPLVGGENFFDGFGFAPYRKKLGWKDDIALDEHERRHKPKRPLLPFLEKLNFARSPRNGTASLVSLFPMTIGCSGNFGPGKKRGKHLEGIRK